MSDTLWPINQHILSFDESGKLWVSSRIRELMAPKEMKKDYLTAGKDWRSFKVVCPVCGETAKTGSDFTSFHIRWPRCIYWCPQKHEGHKEAQGVWVKSFYTHIVTVRKVVDGIGVSADTGNGNGNDDKFGIWAAYTDRGSVVWEASSHTARRFEMNFTEDDKELNEWYEKYYCAKKEEERAAKRKRRAGKRIN